MSGCQGDGFSTMGTYGAIKLAMAGSYVGSVAPISSIVRLPLSSFIIRHLLSMELVGVVIHDSESQIQEEAGFLQQTSELFTCRLKFVNARSQLHKLSEKYSIYVVFNFINSIFMLSFLLRKYCCTS